MLMIKVLLHHPVESMDIGTNQILTTDLSHIDRNSDIYIYDIAVVVVFVFF